VACWRLATKDGIQLFADHVVLPCSNESVVSFSAAR
jgi:hypothetical protein